MRTRAVLVIALVLVTGCAKTTSQRAAVTSPAAAVAGLRIQEFAVPKGSHPHDVAVAPNGTVWFTGQGSGKLGRRDPSTGSVKQIDLGATSGPHGVITGPDGAAWVTAPGLNALVRVDAKTLALRRFPAPDGFDSVGMHTAVFAPDGVLWFTGNAGFFGKLDVRSGRVSVFKAPGGAGPYGITSTPGGEIYYASLQGSHIARVDKSTGRATRIEPPTKGQGARRIWSDSHGRLWITEWNAGNLASYEPATNRWREWRLPGAHPRPYAVFVDDHDAVWLSDFGANAILRFDPVKEAFTSLPLPSKPGDVRQLLGRPGEVWGAESAADAIVLVRTS